MFWSQGQKQLIGTAFIPENQLVVKFVNIPLPCTFNFEGIAYRKIDSKAAIRLDENDENKVYHFSGDELVYPQTNTRSIWQNAYGVRSLG